VEHVNPAGPEADAPPDALAAGGRTPNRQQAPDAQDLARRLKWHVCPFCGHRNENGRLPCGHCGMTDSEETRTATVRRVGPWFLQNPRNPSAPGMKFAVLREMVKAGRVEPNSVIRGPTTQQLWTFAARVRGLAHLFALCWNCNRRLPTPRQGETPDDFCIYCGSILEPPSNPDQQLNVVETGEDLGVSPSKSAGQVGLNPSTDTTAATSSTPEVGRRAARSIGKRRASVSGRVGSAITAPGGAKPVASTVVAGDALASDDALLTPRDLASAFNLDDKPSLWRSLGRLPWSKAGKLLLVLAMLGLAFFYAAGVLLEPLKKALGLG
jgi:hypothetical protein